MSVTLCQALPRSAMGEESNAENPIAKNNGNSFKGWHSHDEIYQGQGLTHTHRCEVGVVN